MEDLVEQFKNDYKKYPPSFLTSKWILEKTPHIFKEDRELYLKTKLLLAEKLQIDSCSIIFVGSSCAGFSLAPHKNFKLFNEDSDVDIAVISHYHFDVAWRELRGIDIYAQPPDVQASIRDHRERLIYYGTIATDKILGLMPFGEQWLEAIGELQKNDLFADREIKFRLYRDHESLRAYHINNFESKISEIVNVKAESITLS